MKKVAIQGISGCYHEMAARRFFRDEDIEIDPCQTFDELFTHMSKDTSLLGIMAIEIQLRVLFYKIMNYLDKVNFVSLVSINSEFRMF